MKLLKPMVLALSLAFIAPALAQDDDLWSHVINTDSTGYWTVNPDRPRVREVDAPGIPGERAYRVRGRAGANPWVVQANSPVQGNIAQGDLVLLLFYARAEEPAEGGSVLPAYVQLNAAPYTSVFNASFRIDGEWKQYCHMGVAGEAFPGGRTQVSVHLGTAEQVVDLGPVFVFTLPANYDRSGLADCSSS